MTGTGRSSFSLAIISRKVPKIKKVPYLQLYNLLNGSDIKIYFFTFVMKLSHNMLTFVEFLISSGLTFKVMLCFEPNI